MRHEAATAYACVAYRIMEYEGDEMSEEYMDILLDMLMGFYTETEIICIYQEDIHFSSCEAILKDAEIKKNVNSITKNW